jgi:hypothetical protein
VPEIVEAFGPARVGDVADVSEEAPAWRWRISSTCPSTWAVEPFPAKEPAQPSLFD